MTFDDKQEMLEQNRKARQRLAGYRAWETRRNNLKAEKEARQVKDSARKESTKKSSQVKNVVDKCAGGKKRYCSTKNITVKNK